MLLLCLRWPQRSEDRQSIVRLAVEDLDWSLFLALARHHRVVPLVARNLQDSLQADEKKLDEGGQAAVAELRETAQAGSFQSLRNLTELRSLVRTFEKEGIKLCVLKGLPVAQAVYGDIGLRSPGDIDVLIGEADLLAADRLLRQAGYTGAIDPAQSSSRRLTFYRAHWKDITYRDDKRGLEVDLHWRCFRNREIRGGSLCTAARVHTSFGSFQVEALPRTEALLHLCVHGTLDGWLYLKSLADIAAQVREMSEAELDELADAASRYDVLPELAAALILVRRWLAIDHWSARLLPEEEPVVACILRYTDHVLVQPGFLGTREKVSIWTTLRFEYGLRRGWPFRRELLLRVLFRPRMWQSIPLPDALFWLYPLLSPLEWLVFRLRAPETKPQPPRATQSP